MTQDPGGDVAIGVRKAASGQLRPGVADAAIVHGLPFDDYLKRGDVSKSTLWTLHTKSPAHCRVEREPSPAMALGSATHCAILEPDAFEDRYVRGPDDRRGLKWKEALDEHGEALLTAGDYDAALAIRDALAHNETIRALTGPDCWREVSAFWRDETGLIVRARPDAFHPRLRLMVDLKTTTDARAGVWRKRVQDFGYHAQEALYTDGFRRCGVEADGFVFIVVETSPPYAHCLFDLAPSAVAEGRAAMRQALDTFAACKAADHWPGYSTDVQSLDLPLYAYRLTEPEQDQ
jgi:exodeoxyribonuclease VIII